MNFSLARQLVMGLALLAGAGGCSQDPPGPNSGGGGSTGGGTTLADNSELKSLAEYKNLKWKDEFDDTSLSLTNWTYEVSNSWFNNELQATTDSRDNVFLNGGYLNIVARRQSYGGRDYTSGRIVTRGKQSFKFGRFDVSAKLPKGKGIWPAIWMLGANDATTPWPACGEIDIMELRGSNPTTNITTLHFGNSVATHKQTPSATYTLPSGDFSDGFHLFSFVRGENKMEFYVDQVKYKTWTTSDASPYPFNNDFYAILNVAVGGDFDGNPDGTTVFPQTMQVDYVRFYQY